MPNGDLIKAGKGIAWGAIAICVTLGLAYLARRDAQTVAATEVRTELQALKKDAVTLNLAMDRVNAYALANYRWTIQVAGRMGWPDPPEPKFFLPQNNYGNGLSEFGGICFDDGDYHVFYTLGGVNETSEVVASSAVGERRTSGS